MAFDIEISPILKTIRLLLTILMLSLFGGTVLYAQEPGKPVHTMSDKELDGKVHGNLQTRNELMAKAEEIEAEAQVESEKYWPDALPALKTVEKNVNRLIAVLDNGKEDKKKKESMRAITDNLFDFSLSSRLSLGWRKKRFTADQLKTFEAIYRELFEARLLNLLEQYEGKKVVAEKGIASSSNKVEVITRLPKRNDTPKGSVRTNYIHYYLFCMDGKWKIYNIAIDHPIVRMDLLINYRAQFSQILTRHSPEELLKMMRRAVEKMK